MYERVEFESIATIMRCLAFGDVQEYPNIIDWRGHSNTYQLGLFSKIGMTINKRTLT